MAVDPFVTVGDRLHEVLGRKRLAVSYADFVGRLNGRRILITGAGGSIGSALAGALAEVGPDCLVLLDAHENSLFRLRQNLAPYGSATALHFILADVRNQMRMRRVLADYEPEIIFHLAAYKHVPLAEELPAEFVAVNVLGTWRLIQEAARSGVGKLVYPSTDKAVNPPSVYGATKRTAELIMRAAAHDFDTPQLSVVRLVNVLGAAGGVVETFVRQISSGQTVTVTDPRMTRYWITMDEALLLLIAGALSDATGNTLLLDLGEPVNVATVAERLWAMLRPEGEPIRLAFSQPRPGERLAEELASAEEHLQPSEYPGIMQVQSTRPPSSVEQLSSVIARMESLVADDSDREIREVIFACARSEF